MLRISLYSRQGFLSSLVKMGCGWGRECQHLYASTKFIGTCVLLLTKRSKSYSLPGRGTGGFTCWRMTGEI